MSSSAQKRAIKEFRAVTSVSDKVASECLGANGYNLERALDDFYSNRHKYSSSSSSSSSSKADSKKLNALFDSYASPDDKDTIDGAQLQKFFGDLGVDVNGAVPLALAWQYKCANFATVERKEFLTYYSSMGIDSLDKMKSDAKRVEGLISDKKTFREFYRWLFNFVKEEEERKTIDVNIACSLWSVVLPPHFPLSSEWLLFVKAQQSGAGLKMISADQWGQLWEFAKEADKELSNYDEDGAWPVIIDEFVEYYRKNHMKAA